MATTTLGTLTPQAKAFYDRRLLERALPILQMFKAGQARNIPKNGGNQVSYRRFNALSVATTALTEGVTPVGDSLTNTEVTGTVAQYGNFVTISDSLATMGIDQVMRESTTVLGENAAQSTEVILRTELVTGTSIQYATGNGREDQGPANPITWSLIRKGVRTLEANDTKPFTGSRNEDSGMGGLFIGFIHPNAWYDMIGSTDIKETFKYSDPEGIYKMNIPVIGGVAWVKTTYAPVFSGSGSGSPAADVYGTIICGLNAFGVVDVAGTGRFANEMKDFGSGGTADPLSQRATVGWKSWQLPKILNGNFMVRLEHGVSA